MRNEYQTRPATFNDALTIAADARQADVDEVMAARGVSMLRALYDGLRLSDRAFTALVNGVPVCIFGIAPRSRVYRAGAPWMLGSNQLDRYQRAFIRRSKPYFYPLAMHYVELENYVDARNAATIRWLRWLGFEIDEAQPYGVAGLPFHRFHMKA